MRTRLITVAAIDIALLAGGFVLRTVDSVGDAALSLAVMAIGVVTLLGLLAGRDTNTKVTTRFALTVAVSAVWFSSVGILMFFVGEQAPLANEAFNSISVVMGVVVAFYFGAQAYEAVGTARAKHGGEAAKTDTGDAGTVTRGGRSAGDATDAPPVDKPSIEVYD